MHLVAAEATSNNNDDDCARRQMLFKTNSQKAKHVVVVYILIVHGSEDWTQEASICKSLCRSFLTTRSLRWAEAGPDLGGTTTRFM